MRTLVWNSALQEDLDTYPLSPGAILPHLSPPPTFASFHLPLPPSGFTHPHACTHAHSSRDSHTSGFSHALTHTEKSGKSVPCLIELKDWGLAGHCVSELQLLTAVSAPDRRLPAIPAAAAPLPSFRPPLSKLEDGEGPGQRHDAPPPFSHCFALWYCW